MAEGKKWFLYGCLGCLGMVGLVVLSGAIVSGVAWLQVGREQVDEHVSTQPLPESGGHQAASPEVLEPPVDPGRVLLELARAEFEIEPLPPGEPVRVEATYDKNSYELVESMEREEGAGWTYRVRFRGTGSNLMSGLRQLFGGSQPKVRICLPVDVPMSLEVELEQGGVIMDLGGLWLTEVDLQLTQGGFQVEVDEPLRRPLERMTLRGSMGGMETSRLGNASPRRLEVDFSMGGLELDLRGDWVTDSDISIRTSMGGAVLRLPRDVMIEGLDDGSFRLPEETEIALPTLRFDVSTTSGDLEIIP